MIRMAIEVITPEVAERYLQANKVNRPISLSHVMKLARDMDADGWELNGETIKFNGDGSLFDGQHRLVACMRTGKAFTSAVVRGVDQSGYLVTDTGKPRSFGNVLTMLDFSNVSKLSAAVKFDWRYQRGVVLANPSDKGGVTPSNRELLAHLEQHPSLATMVKEIANLLNRVRLPAGATASIRYRLGLIDHEDEIAFFDKLESGVDLPEGSPILALRRWIELHSLATHPATSITKAAILIKAINYWRLGKSVKTIGWRRGGANEEAFPMLIKEVS